ncbi:MAG: NAD(P)-dependent oxidoreductase [Taibaiella sp.]|nr:NAD(P)-dependent oxidoreductase [Taibaiella sp.]
MKITNYLGALALLALSFLSSCGTMFCPGYQTVTVKSTTPGAHISYNGTVVGDGSAKVKLKKKRAYQQFIVTKEGYKDQSYIACLHKRSPMFAFVVLDLFPFFGQFSYFVVDRRATRSFMYDKEQRIPAMVKLDNRADEKYLFINKTAVAAAKNDVVELAADAVRGAERIHLTLKDDAAVDEVLALAEAGFNPGVVIIDHTTTSTQGAERRTEVWHSKGFTYLHAPVFMGPANALESTGMMLVSGDQERIAQLEPVLAAMTGRVLNFGTEVSRAATIKLAGNLLLVAINAGLADMLSLTAATGTPLSDLEALFSAWNPGIMLPARLKKMTSGSFDQPTWELNMARKDVGLMLGEIAQSDTPLAVLPAVAAEMDRWIAKGHGADDYTVVGKDTMRKLNN